MKKQDLRDSILRWAKEYAKTGDYEGYTEIEIHIRNQDRYPEARNVLDDDILRNELDELCQKARKKINEC